MSGILYLVSIPIGNQHDFTPRALSTLQNVNLVVVEEYKEGKKFLDLNKIDKPIEELNEHNEETSTLEILQVLIEGKKVALISDCGTPLFSDPGLQLVQSAIQNRIKIVPIPGASSILSALVVSGFNIERFLYYGWVSPKKEIRKKELYEIRNIRYTLIVMETPYRLHSLMEDVVKAWGTKRRVCLALNLTMKDELILNTTTGELLQKLTKEKIKGEYVLIFEGT